MTRKRKYQCTRTLRPLLAGYDYAGHKVFLYLPPCHLWACPGCAQCNARMWMKRIADGVREYMENGEKSWRFVTLTAHRRNQTFDRSLHAWPSAWAKLSTRLRRGFGGVHYASVLEKHQSGAVHMHACMNQPVTTRWLKDNSAACGFGYIAESKPLYNPSGAAFYIAKYLMKSLSVQWPRGFRRVRTSRNWPALRPESDFRPLELDWRVLAKTASEETLWRHALDLAERTGMEVELL